MSTQQPLLFGAPNAYNAPLSSPSDPSTSREAGQRTEKSGARGRHCEIVWQAVIAHPGMTGYELWELLSSSAREELKEVQAVYKRLNDLREAGRVWQGPPKKCSVKKRSMVVWNPGSSPA